MYLNNQRGFTLVELLMALMLAAVVATSLVTVTRTMSETAKSQQMVIESSEAARAGIDMLRMDLMRVGMFVAADPRHDTNPTSLVSKTGGNIQKGYYRNPIVHLNSPKGTNAGAGMDSVVLIGNFIGDKAYEGEIDMGTADTIKITSGIKKGMCKDEFNPKYAFAHIITGTGQTHEAKVKDVSEENCNAVNICECVITTEPGELIDGIFGERNIKIAANQAIMYKVESVDKRNVLMRYFINYDGSSSIGDNCTKPTNATDYIDYKSAVVIAENVVDFQIWFRSISKASTSGNIDLANYHTTTAIKNNSKGIPDPAYVIVGNTYPSEATARVHLSCPVGTSVIRPQHVRSAIVSLAVRSEKTDPSLRLTKEIDTDTASTGTDTGLMAKELAPPPSGDVGMYRIRRYNIEVGMPNLMAQMGNSQFVGTPAF